MVWWLRRGSLRPSRASGTKRSSCLPVNVMTQETDEGLAYLQALKGSAPAPAPRTVSPSETNSAFAFERAPAQNSAGPQTLTLEKRRSPRYKCEGSVEICQEGFELRTWATCTDVSMHGCYVEATTTYPVGTNVHVKLQANEFQIQSEGCVRVAYPALGMGIAFVEMSEETRTRLRELLRTISRPSVILGPGISPSAPWGGALMSISLPADATAALRALAEFFESRQLLMRDEFLRILRKSQADAKLPGQVQGTL